MNDILCEIQKDKLIQKYICKNCWLSGSNTFVYPLSLFIDKNNKIKQIIIQVNIGKNVFGKLIKRYKDKYNNMKDGYFSKSDGSCPSTINFIFKEE